MPQTFDHAHRPFQTAQRPKDADLDALERALGAPLPGEYRAFLRDLNGGSLRPFAFELEVPGSAFRERVHALDYLYEVREVTRRSQLGLDPALRNLPPGRAAIGVTVSQLTLTLDLSPGGRGRIEAWVRDTLHLWGEGTNTTVVPLADSFPAFLAMLGPHPEAYAPFWVDFERDGETARRVTLP